ncbi:MAG: allantoinase AllB [Euzebya sp.]
MADQPLVDLLISSRRVLTADGLRPATVVVDGGRIVEVLDDDVSLPHARTLEQVEDLVVLPGLVDSHVHCNEPGRTQWEGFATATRAAAAGGVTTIVDMPLNCIPPTTDAEALTAKRTAAAPAAFIDVAFWGGAVPGNDDDLPALHAAGVRGFKAFLCDSGVPEYGNIHPAQIAGTLARIAKLDSTLIVHAEDPQLCQAAAQSVAGRDPRRYSTWLDSRPEQAEVAAVRALVDACRQTGGRVHVLHVSAAQAADVIADAQAEGLPVTAETCPHYLTLSAELVPDGATEFKCAPPIRVQANAERLWDHLAAGTITAVVSDHSPCPPADKRPETGDFMAAWGGISSLQIGLPLVWTEARRRGHDLAAVMRWMSFGPAQIAGLSGKGAIAAGHAADLVVFDPDARWQIDGTALHHRHPVTPHHDRPVTGAVISTYLAGQLVVHDGQPVGDPTGRLL